MIQMPASRTFEHRFTFVNGNQGYEEYGKIPPNPALFQFPFMTAIGTIAAHGQSILNRFHFPVDADD